MILTTVVAALTVSTSTTMAQDGAAKKEPRKTKTVQITQAQLKAYQAAFQRYLQVGPQFKDADAIRLSKLAKESGGELKVSLNEMIVLVNKWKKNGAPTRFKKLFSAKLKANDPDAVELKKSATGKDGKMKLELTPEKMLEYIAKWESTSKDDDPIQILD